MAWIPFAAAGAGALLSSVLNKKGAPQQTTQQMDQNPWAPTIPYLNEIMQRVQQYGNSPLPYSQPSDMVAGLTPQQQQAAGMVSQGAGNGMQLNQEAQAGIQPFLNGSMMNVDSNPYLQAAIGAAIRPITQNYQENVLPGVRSAFTTNTDAYDQSREGIASGIASRGYLDAVGATASGMANRGYETGLQATQQAFNQVPGLTTASTAPGQAQWNIGALLQAQQQNQINAPGAFDQLQQQRLAFPAGIYGQYAGIGRTGGGTTTTTGGQPNPFLSAVGGGILGQQVYNMWPKTPTTPAPAPDTSGVGGYTYPG